MLRHGDAVGRQLVHNHGGKAVLNQPAGHLAAGGDKAAGLQLPGGEAQDGGVPRPGLHCLQLVLSDDQRDDAGARQLVPPADRRVGVAGGDHDLVLAVEGVEPLHVHLEQAVAVGDELDFALLHRRGVHVLVLAQGPQPLRRLVLVEHARRLLPHVQVLLAHGEQDGDVLLPDHMALAEPGVLGDAGDDLGQIVAEHVPHRAAGVNQLHIQSLLAA